MSFFDSLVNEMQLIVLCSALLMEDLSVVSLVLLGPLNSQWYCAEHTINNGLTFLSFFNVFCFSLGCCVNDLKIILLILLEFCRF